MIQNHIAKEYEIETVAHLKFVTAISVNLGILCQENWKVDQKTNHLLFIYQKEKDPNECLS